MYCVMLYGMNILTTENQGGLSKAGSYLLSKVPEVTIFFWIIKVLCTTVGETAADFLNVNLNFGLTGTSIVTGTLLVVVLFFQFRAKKYVPWIYWLTVALISVFGTLVTDNLTDKLGVPLEISTIVFSVLLALTFLIWYLKEKTLSIHSILTVRREIFYWLTILFTFALGTAAGDLMAEGLGLGYLVTGIIIAVIIILVVVARKLKLNSVLAFWLVYIMTRPLGASIGDLLTQTRDHGGLGFGATITSAIFVAGILGTVAYLSFTKRDVVTNPDIEKNDGSKEKGGLRQTIIVVAVLIIAGLIGYFVRQASLQAAITAATPAGGTAVTSSSFGDLTVFRTITQDTLSLLNTGNQSGATTRISDLEYEWDNAQSRLKPRDKTKWTGIDGKIDVVLRELRAVHPNITTEKAALNNLLTVLN